MNVQALISFTGAVSMKQGEDRGFDDESPALKDLLQAGYVCEFFNKTILGEPLFIGEEQEGNEPFDVGKLRFVSEEWIDDEPKPDEENAKLEKSLQKAADIGEAQALATKATNKPAGGKGDKKAAEK